MFQMSKKLFHECWPQIAAHIEAAKHAKSAGSDAAPASSPSTAAEAGYMLGVAIGYALKLDYPTMAPVSSSVPYWRADACGGDMNWPRVAPSPVPLRLDSHLV